ncbi:MAG: efflux RND transporter permease subunit [Acidobacteriia bacterium]|jgi:HAE1 family hydrophobic/amphiphilic exporter-1|nr:efflux RND transporter permease subunit [Terriglobia bacterium]
MKLAEICVRRPVFAVMLIAFLVTLGIFSYRELGVDLFPKADPATVFVGVSLPGASPEEMISSVVLPLEDAISSVNGLEEMNVWAFEGNARIVCTFVLERDIEGAAQDVREKVAGALNRLPPGVLPPVIRKADPDSDPILTLLVSGPMSRRELTEIADKQVRRAIQTVNGVGEVSLNGGQGRQIRLLVDAERLTAHNLTVLDVRNAIRSENVELPGGRVIHGAEELGLRTLGRVSSVEQFADVILANRGGTPIRVRDVARVEDGAEELRSWSALRGKDVVSVEIRRQSGMNTVRVADAVKQRIAELRRELPAGVELQIISDASVFIRASVNSLLEHLILGSILASLIVLLFIRNWRAVFIAALAIPTSIIATFTLMRAMDFTLNNMTLLALTLAVGIVIDDAIIVLENIFRYMEEKGVPPLQAAVEATREIGPAVMATTLSLVIIFLPIAFMTGYARRYVNEFGWTMAMAILVSLLVSFTLTPMLSSKYLRVRREAGHVHSRESKFARRVESGYLRILNWSLEHRPAVLLICALTFASTFVFYRLIGRDWIPPDDQSELNSSIDLPEGTALSITSATMNDMAQRLEAMPEVEFVHAYTHGMPNHGHLYIRLVEPGQRKRNHEQMAEAIRQVLGSYRNVTYNVRLPSTLGGENWYPIRAIIRGPDVSRLVEISKQVAAEMSRFPGLVDVNPMINLNTPELQVKVDRQRAADLGVRMTDIGATVRLLFSGQDEISTYKEGAEQYPVTMQLLPEQRDNPAILGRLMVPSAKVGQVRLDNIATIQRGGGPDRLQRYNREFQVSVGANLAPGTPLDAAAAHTIASIRKVGLPPGYSFVFAGQVRLLEQTTYNMLLAMLLASIFMYMVLAAQFESFKDPFIILLTLPLSIPFALFSLWITGRSLSLWSALGVFLLLGIVKKNGILQVDYTNQLRREGVPLREAILEANRVRLRPILMTTFSIVAGLIPVAVGIGAGSEQRASIAVTIIGGQTLCLLLTLLVVPVAYSYFAEWQAAFATVGARTPWGRWRTAVARRFGLFS